MPKLWTDTIAAHREEVTVAVLDAVGAMVREAGVTSLSMSAVAQRVGITRATLYKYYPEVGALLAAWQTRQVASNVGALVLARDRAKGPEARLTALLKTYAALVYEQHSPELLALLQHTAAAIRGYDELEEMLSEVIAEGVATGSWRGDVSPEELARFCVHALGAASTATSQAAVARLVTVTVDALRR